MSHLSIQKKKTYVSFILSFLLKIALLFKHRNKDQEQQPLANNQARMHSTLIGVS